MFTALSLIAFAYAGGITMISGAVFAGLISTQALFPYALDKWFGLSGNWFLLFGGVILIVTLLQNPEGVMGAIYKKRHRRQPVVPPKDREAAAPGAAGAAPRGASRGRRVRPDRRCSRRRACRSISTASTRCATSASRSARASSSA